MTIRFYNFYSWYDVNASHITIKRISVSWWYTRYWPYGIDHMVLTTYHAWPHPVPRRHTPGWGCATNEWFVMCRSLDLILVFCNKQDYVKILWDPISHPETPRKSPHSKISFRHLLIYSFAHNLFKYDISLNISKARLNFSLLKQKVWSCCFLHFFKTIFSGLSSLQRHNQAQPYHK